jgi:hypothetical protein
MANSTALAYRQFQSIDNTGTGAGQQWLHLLWQCFQYFMDSADEVDAGRWRLVDSSPAMGSWGTLSNIVDNSWFVIEAQKGRRQWQAKFQATNVAALDESPAGTYRLAINLCSGGGWTAKGGANGGFASSAVVCSTNLLLGGTDQSANPDGEVIIHGDRDTVLIASTLTGDVDFACGAYLGRFEADTSTITYPECILTPWDGGGSPKGFDREPTGGVFATTPADSFVLNQNTPAPIGEPVQCWTPGWLSTGTHEPSGFSGEYHYRPIDITSNSAYLGTLRLVFSASGVTSRSRLNARQLLVLNNAAATYSVAIQHNGVVPP